MSSPVNVGDILAGKYRVERVLGAGGMGVVVAARHLTLGDRVAIKFLLPDALSQPDVVARFLREGQAAARLRSEHVARVHDVGKLESGAPFLVMEFLDGQELGAVLKSTGRMPVDTAVDYVLQACEALAEAHAAGVIHRDLKPSNLYVVERNDGTPQVKLIDFGISKVREAAGSEGKDGDMTNTAVMMGSPYYMAPEQMASARDVDVRADLWSLGVILHMLVAGTLPFRAPSVMEIFEKILKGAPPLRALAPDTPEGIEAAVLRCLQRDREQRFANVSELALAIAPFGGPGAVSSAERVKRILFARPSREVWSAPLTDMVPVAALTPVSQKAPPTTSVAPEVPVAERASSGDEPGRILHTLPLGVASPPSVASGATSSSDFAPPSAPSGPGAASPLSPLRPLAAISSPSLDASPTGGPWDQETSPPVRRPTSRALLVAVAIAVVGAPLAYLALRHGDGPDATQSREQATDTSNAAPSNAASPPVAPPPSVEPAPPPITTTSADAPKPAPASTSVTSTPNAPNAQSGQNAQNVNARRPAGPAGKPRRKPGDDLFGTQK